MGSLVVRKGGSRGRVCANHSTTETLQLFISIETFEGCCREPDALWLTVWRLPALFCILGASSGRSATRSEDGYFLKPVSFRHCHGSVTCGPNARLTATWGVPIGLCLD